MLDWIWTHQLKYRGGADDVLPTKRSGITDLEQGKVNLGNMHPGGCTVAGQVIGSVSLPTSTC